MSRTLPTREESIAKVKKFFDRVDEWQAEKNGVGFDGDIMNRCTIRDASAEGRIVVELDLDQSYGNITGALHGGAVGLIFDMFTCAAYIPMPFFDVQKPGYVIPAGYSWNMNYTCLRGLPLPARVCVEGNVVHNGKKMKLIRGSITSLDRKKTYYVCEHHVAAIDEYPQKLPPPSKL